MLHKNIIKLAALLWCVLTVASCTNEDFDKGSSGPDVPKGLPVTLKLNIGTPEVPVVETKALDNGGKFGSINNLAVLVYDEKGENPVVTFYDVNQTDQTSVSGVSFKAKTGKHKIYVLTNVGSEDAAKIYATEADLLSAQIGASRDPNGGEMMLGFVAKDMDTSIALYEKGRNELIEITGDNGSYNAKVVPPYSKITFKITKNLPSDKHVYLAITEVNVRNLPVKYSLLPYQKWAIGDVSTGTSNLYKNASAKPEEEVGELATGKNFYMFENLQGVNNTGNTDPMLKTPAGLTVPTSGDGKIDYATWFQKWTTVPCTYIEVKGHYTIFTSEGKVNHVGDGEINYRFFLGENSTSDFNIKRNTHYNVTLAFTGLAGKNELKYEWRVQADLENSTFYPKGTLVIDGTKGDFGLVPFFVLNGGKSGEVIFKTDGLDRSDMMVKYTNVDNFIDVGSIPYNPKPISPNTYGEFGVRANNLGIIHGAGQSQYNDDNSNVYRENGTGIAVNQNIEQNYTRRDDVANGLIYRIRNFYINGTGVNETLVVKEHPLLYLGDKNNCSPLVEGAIYARRLDQPKGESSSLDAAKKACKYGEYAGEGYLNHYLPTKVELEKIISLEKAFPLTNGANYWTLNGIFKFQGGVLIPAEGNIGSVRCIFKVN